MDQTKKRAETTIAERNIVINLFKQQKSQREIAEILSKSRSTVKSIIKRYQESGNTKNKPRSGRPTKVSERLERSIVRQIKENPKKTAPKIATDLAESNYVHVTPQTVRNILKKNGYNGRVARKKAMVSKANKKKRLDFAVRHENRPQSFWNKVLWSDESKFELFSTKRRVNVWRKANTALDPKHLVPTVKHGGGSVMVWGCMSTAGPGNLVFIDGKMDQYVYKNILKENVIQSAQKLGIDSDFIFQQDNDPKHTARSVTRWLTENVENVLEWPAQSPDLNPIEHLWDHLDRQIRKRTISSKNQLKSVIEEEWNKIPATVTQKLVASMSHRLQAVQKSKGFPTKY